MFAIFYSYYNRIIKWSKAIKNILCDVNDETKMERVEEESHSIDWIVLVESLELNVC